MTTHHKTHPTPADHTGHHAKHDAHVEDASPPAEARTGEISVAYERRKHEIDAVSEKALVLLNLDVSRTMPGMTAKLAKIDPMLERFKVELEGVKKVDHVLMGSAHELAQAVEHANVLVMAAPAAKNAAIIPLAAKVQTARELLVSDLGALAKRGIGDQKRLDAIVPRSGYKNNADDLLAFVAIGRELLLAAQGKSGLSAVQLDEAEHDGNELQRAAGARDVPDTATDDVQLRLHKAFTLFVRAHAEITRCLTFLLWYEPAGAIEKVLPSLYFARQKHAVSSDDANDTTTPTPTLPTTTTADDEPLHAPIVDKLPGGNPFKS